MNAFKAPEAVSADAVSRALDLMDIDDLTAWLDVSPRRSLTLRTFNQPLTATQLAQRLSISTESAAFCLWQLSSRGVVACLNPQANGNRLHWLTSLGTDMQKQLRSTHGQNQLSHSAPEINWLLYSDMLFRHRAAVLTAMNGPMQPADIRRKAVNQDPGLKMSANNCRDVMSVLVTHGLVESVSVQGRAHLHYQLTELGRIFKRLIRQGHHLP